MNEKIKQLIGFIKKYIGEIVLIIGAGLFFYNIFNFSYKEIGGTTGLCNDLDLCHDVTGVAYYYPYGVLEWISIGAMLIVAGILIIKRK